MLVIYYELCHQLEEELMALNDEFPEILKRSEQSIKCITGYLSRIKQNVLDSGFTDLADEIIFFKHIKPQVFHWLIYFNKVLNIESAKPSVSSQFLKKYYRAELKKLRFFYNENKEFCQYYRKGLTHLDKIYFIRGQVPIGFLNDSVYFNADPLFSTPKDYKVSCLLAYDKLANYLQDAIALTDLQPSRLSNKESRNLQSLNWTDTKIAMVELIYALHATGCLNNGKAGIKEIATFFSQALSIDLGDFYRNYLEIKNRNNHTKFLDQLRENLQKKIQQQDC